MLARLNVPYDITNVTWACVGNGVTLANGMGNTASIYGTVVPIVNVTQTNGIWYGQDFAPGIEWLRVSGDQIAGITPSRALRICPDANLTAGADQTLASGSTYNHAADVRMAITTGVRYSASVTDITQGVFPDNPMAAAQAAIQGTLPAAYQTTFNGENNKYMAVNVGQMDLNAAHTAQQLPSNATYTATVPPGGVMYVTGTKAGTNIGLDNNGTGTGNAATGSTSIDDKFNGVTAFAAADTGVYTLTYDWVLSDQRYLEDSKIITLDAPLDVKVTEQFREFSNTSNILDTTNDGHQTTLNPGNPFYHGGGVIGAPPQVLQSGGNYYVYYGLSTDGGTTVDTTAWSSLPLILIPSVDANTTITYLYKLIPPADAVKNAYINGLPPATPAKNGTAAKPEPVSLGDTLNYQISLDNPGPYGQIPRYNIVFALDWSGSMNSGLFGSGADQTTALAWERRLMLDTTAYVMTHYPGSNICVMGMNSMAYGTDGNPGNNGDNPTALYVQFNTGFTGVAGYTAAINSAMDSFNTTFKYSSDDNAQFLKAATAEFSASGNGLTAQQQADNIPVVIVISDFQMTDTVSGNTLIPNYWSQHMKNAAQNFISATGGKGILLNVRADHSQNAGYSGTTYDQLMNNLIALGGTHPDGSTKWGWIAVGDNTTPLDPAVDTPYTTADQTLSALLTSKAPPYIPAASTVTDVVPAGLTVDITSISNGGTYDSATRTITWDLNAIPAGQTTLSFKTTVAQEGEFINKAHIAAWSQAAFDTDPPTYHICSPHYTLYIRQVVLDPNAGVEQPQMGYFSLTDVGKNVLPLTGVSGLDDPVTGYTKYLLNPTAGGKFTLTDTMPQYYKYVGWFSSPYKSIMDGSYDTSTADFAMGPDENGSIPLNFLSSANKTLWVTVYITPTTSTVTNYQWSYATNNVGTINP